MGRIQSFDVQSTYKVSLWDFVLVGAVIAFFVF